jgi:hypothetical protein
MPAWVKASENDMGFSSCGAVRGLRYPAGREGKYSLARDEGEICSRFKVQGST